MFRERLQTLAARIPGVAALVLVGGDGIAVDSVVVDQALDLEMLSAEMTALTRAMAQNHRELSMGSLRGLNVSTERFRISVHEVSAGFYLMLVAENDGSAGRARYELRRSPLILAEELS